MRSKYVSNDNRVIAGIFRMGKNHSPCIDVCIYRDDGHCSGCSMTRIQKKISKILKSKDKQLAFVELIRMQQSLLGDFENWEKVRSRQKGAKN